MTASVSASFPAALRRHRLAAGLSQGALAERAGLSLRGVSDLERGLRSPRPETLRMLADALGLEARARAEFAAAAWPASRAEVDGPGGDAAGRAALPLPLTPLVGRAAEVAEVVGLLCPPGVRLLTLIGPGGVGKTRLGLQAAADLSASFRDGVSFVGLAPITEPDLVASAIAGTLGARETPVGSSVRNLVASLRERQLLLVLDNFEHLAAAAALVGDLLVACPDLTVLATSRAPLRIYGERTFAVPPLALPDPRRPPPPDELVDYAAIRLFVDRAQAVTSAFSVTTDNAAAVAAICHRVDGLPLAIELAAARVKLLPPPVLLARLEHRLGLLTDGAVDRHPRQQALRSTIAWSHDLLDPTGRAVFRRLTVFPGGCDLVAAEEVCAAVGCVGGTVLDGLASLVDNSLLQRVDPGGNSPRFAMLETIREFGLERLAESGEEEAARKAQVRWCLSLTETAEPQLRGPDQGAWLARLETEHDNLRAALGWLIERAEVDAALRLGTLLWRFWYVRGYLSEGRGWLERALAMGGASPDARAAALHGAGTLAWAQGDYATAASRCGESLTLRRTLGDQRGVAASLNALGNVAQAEGDRPRATALFEEGLALFRALGDERGVETALHNLGRIAHEQGDHARATARYEESLALARGVADKEGTAVTLDNLAAIAYEQGDHGRAAARYRESLELYGELGDQTRVAACLEGFVRVIATRRPSQAARLLAAAARLREAIGVPVEPVEHPTYERTVADLRTALGDDVFAAARASGGDLSAAEAVAEALETADQLARHGE